MTLRFSARRSVVWTTALALCLGASSAWAGVTEIGPGEDLPGAVAALKPGDELVLKGGEYALTARFGISVKGTAQAPIVIRAKAGEHPVISRSDANQNTIDLDDTEYLVLRGLEVKGGSLGIRGVLARFVTIEACEIHDTGDVALSFNSGGVYEGLKILRNHIHHTNGTGEGMYLGCNNNACRVFDSLIEGNYVHHTNSATVEQGDGIELKEGSYNNILRDNVIHDTKYPCILTYSTVGNGAPNIIERNVLWHCGDNGIQSAADAIIRNNIVLGAASYALAMQPHQAGTPSNLTVVHNTLLQPTGDAVRVSGITGKVVFANNAVYSASGLALKVVGEASQLVLAGNVGQGSLEGVSSGFQAVGNISTNFVAGNYNGMPPIDLFPSAGSPLIGAGDSAYVPADDFNGTARGGVADIGAYKYAAGPNPGWALAESFKDGLAAAGAGGAGGTGGAGAAGTGGNPTVGGSGGTSPATDGGAGAAKGGSGGADSGVAGGAPDGGPQAAAPASSDDGGCGCRLHPSRSSRLSALLVLAVGLLRRRRRSTAPQDTGSRRL